MPTYYYWTKKIDDLHLHQGNTSTTLCGKPMLGNNYQAIYPDRKLCAECVRIVEKENSKIFFERRRIRGGL